MKSHKMKISLLA